MWLYGADEVIELFKGSFPYSFLFLVPILIIISPVSPVAAANEFSVLRMQQYDLQGASYGRRQTKIMLLSALFNLQSKPVEHRPSHLLFSH